ncbi:MAG TPA: Ig-like domain-containing protein, partial [Cytophagaceae bacterium]|nr:Ig-like domain-containing protein [Cytophagaceae bacterium]
MLVKTVNLCIATVLSVLLFSCSGNKLKLDDKNFNEEIELQQNLVFNFNKDLVPDSLVNVWVEDAYVTFTPEVKGKFKWTAKDELIFSPDISFAPCTDYKAELTDKIIKKAAVKYALPDEKSYNFHTPY